VLLAVSVRVLLPVVGFGLKVAVTPLGNPDAARVTLPVNPPRSVTEIVLTPDAPCASTRLLGLAASVKPGGGLTVRFSVVVADGTPVALPVIVTVAAPSTAVLLAVSVRVLLPVVGFGLKVAVTPLGNPDAARVTLPVNPPISVTETVLTPDAPWARTRLLGLAARVKPGGGFTVRFSVVVADGKPVALPVIVTVAAPSTAVLLAVSVRVLLPVVGFGTKVAVTPVGRPDAERVTLPVNPPISVTETVLTPDAPWASTRLFGFAASVKPGGGFTVRFSVVVADGTPVALPVIVTVAAPSKAVLLAVSVRVLLPVVGFGTKVAVTPVGRPDAARVTLPVNPPTSLTATVLTPDAPCARTRLLGLAARVKPGGGFTVRFSVVVADGTPVELPVIVTVAAPSTAVLLAVSVRVLLPVVGFGLKVAVTPLGNPDAARVTLPVNPPTSLTATVLTPDAPCASTRLFGFAASVKPGGGLTVRFSVVVADGTPVELPVMVTVAGPSTAVLLAVSVRVLLPVVGFGTKVAVIPPGRPDAARVTLPVNPPTSLTETVLTPDAPWAMVRLPGLAESVKPGGGLTVRFSVVVADGTPVALPLIVTVAAPSAAVLLAVSVRVLLPVAGFGLKVAVTPPGRPDAERVTLPVNPPMSLTVTVLTPDAPCATVRVFGLAASVKPGGGFTVRFSVVVADGTPVELPVIVTVAAPSTAVLLAVSVRVLLPVVGFGLKVAVTPLGNPDAARVTLPVNPPTSVAVTVLAPDAPCAIVKLFGLAASVKPGVCAGPAG
jgi:hypothetical protein